ncbi:hypothetical protein ACFFIX_04135 [Metabacillus herbersteinensis]|uniref:Lipoyl-binding domain-containing protein n=1 Tax=Metabacillus herbersteinensis TaxID=283816 RepID=A0ABV6GCG1_9BACI
MIQRYHTIESPYDGIIDKVYISENCHVYEWENLFLIKTASGKIEEISVGASGHITSLEVNQGDHVKRDMLLASLKDDFSITGSD